MSDPAPDHPRGAAALRRVREVLLAERASGGNGNWEGELSTSALSTATAVTALAVHARERNSGGSAGHPDDSTLIERGLEWLATHQNADGGWGDTTRSISNISTTVLGWAAFGAVPGGDARFAAAVEAASRWITLRTGALDADSLSRAIVARYGRDRTFSIPILTMCALSGRLGPPARAWEKVMPLPFELAALPHGLFAALRLPVVSYALPALIAIGQVRHFHRPPRNPATRVLRRLAWHRTMRVLDEIQPVNGGFLEATPLTSFVTMSLAGSGRAQHPVTQRGLGFLRASVRPDGSWPIDTHLATWVTTLSINALGHGVREHLPARERERLLEWLLAQQYREEHPYTHAAPGGWAWTPLPGGVPDADDTAGALLALHHLGDDSERVQSAARAGIEWLLDLQNRDGGVPTFCRGWGALPFDRSGADLTAHAVRAWLAWRPRLSSDLRGRVDRALRRALRHLAATQRPDGAWLPLWFGNQFGHDDENPVYGTARVVEALGEAARHGLAGAGELATRGAVWLVQAGNPDGSWGSDGNGSGTVEDTALALGALAGCDLTSPVGDAIRRGTDWLAAQVESGKWREPSPIGFYFARLWYFEQLYPVIFTAATLERVAERPTRPRTTP